MTIGELSKLAAVYGFKVKVDQKNMEIIDSFKNVQAAVPFDSRGGYGWLAWMGKGMPELLANAVIQFSYSDTCLRMKN